jgi:hypothetical protein
MPWPLQLYMWGPIRNRILVRHDFYVEQVKKRALTNFKDQDIEAEARRHMESEYNAISRHADPDYIDQAQAAEWAQERGYAFYELLSDLRTQLHLSALAALFHRWEIELRNFIESELEHDVEAASARKVAWTGTLNEVLDILRQFGWDVAASDLFPKIDATRLIVNVHKHGKGPSLKELARTYPLYLSGPNGRENIEGIEPDMIDHEWLDLNQAQFDELAFNLRTFWEQFPERLWYPPR